MATQRYRVVGERAVAGVKPGGTLVPPGDANVRALVKAGHLEPVEPVGEQGPEAVDVGEGATVKPSKRRKAED